MIQLFEQLISSPIEFSDFAYNAADHKIDFLGKPALKQVTTKLLIAYVKDTYRACSYYHNLLDSHKISVSSIKNLDDFRKIPLLSPSRVNIIQPEELLPDTYLEAIKKGLSLRTLPPEARIAQKFSTSGSSGKPKVVYYTKRDWDNAQGAIMRALQHIPFQDYSRTFNCFNPGHVAAPVFKDSLHKAGALVVSKHFTHTDEKLILNQMNSEYSHLGDFNCLAIPPCTPPGGVQKGGTLRALLDNDTENIIGKNIRLIITTGAPREHPSYKFNLIEEVHELNELAGGKFKTKFVDFAGCAEVLPTMAECQNYGEGMHLLPGLTFTEVIDSETGEHVRDGERGLLVYTSLKYGSRYIRYVVGDEATYIEEPCSCGRTTSRIRNISRVLDKSRLEGGCASGF